MHNTIPLLCIFYKIIEYCEAVELFLPLPREGVIQLQ